MRLYHRGAKLLLWQAIHNMIADNSNQVYPTAGNFEKGKSKLDQEPGYLANGAKPDKSTAVKSEAIPPPGQYCVYAILCDDNSLYIGYTNDLSRRWREHQAGSAARWTKKHKPQRIAYFELAPSREAAMRMEREWKAHRRKKLKRLVEDGKAR